MGKKRVSIMGEVIGEIGFSLLVKTQSGRTFMVYKYDVDERCRRPTKPRRRKSSTKGEK